MKSELFISPEIPTSMITFITTNQEKIDMAKKHLHPLGIEFSTEAIELPEIQSDSSMEIAEKKALAAYSIVKKPIIITDHSWSIPALNGFPGPFMKFMNKWLSPEDLLSMMSNHDDRRIIKTELLFFVDKFRVKNFQSSLEGKILTKPKGEGLPMMRVVSLLPSEKSVAECISAGEDQGSNYSLWEDFAKWYLNYKNQNNI